MPSPRSQDAFQGPTRPAPRQGSPPRPGSDRDSEGVGTARRRHGEMVVSGPRDAQYATTSRRAAAYVMDGALILAVWLGAG